MAKKHNTILLIDDDIIILDMGREILENEYNVYPVLSGKLAFELLKKVTPDLILLDIAMPEMDGYKVLKELKSNPNTAGIPVIFLTSMDDRFNEYEGLKNGAVDYITKPFSVMVFRQRIENQLRIHQEKKELEKRNKELQDLVGR